MATIPGFSYALTEESALHHLLHLQLPDSADLFELADTCAAYVSVLVETDDAVTFATLCKQLLAALKRMRERCDSELPPYLVEQLIAGGKDRLLRTGLLAGYGVAGGLCCGVNAGGNGRDVACERGERTHRAAA